MPSHSEHRITPVIETPGSSLLSLEIRRLPGELAYTIDIQYSQFSIHVNVWVNDKLHSFSHWEIAVPEVGQGRRPD
jgi:hypothetical protein